MPFSATCMHLEIIILSEVTQTDKNKYMKYHIYVESHFEKKDTNESICKTEADLDIKNKPMVMKRETWKGEDKSAAWDEYMPTTAFNKIDN